MSASSICKGYLDAWPSRHASPSSFHFNTPATRGKDAQSSAVLRLHSILTTSGAATLNQDERYNDLINGLIGSVKQDQWGDWGLGIRVRWPSRDVLSLLSVNPPLLSLLSVVASETFSANLVQRCDKCPNETNRAEPGSKIAKLPMHATDIATVGHPGSW
jgi:hypothetical protein